MDLVGAWLDFYTDADQNQLPGTRRFGVFVLTTWKGLGIDLY